LVCFYTVETGEGTPYSGPWVTDVSPEEVRERYNGWEPDLITLLKVSFLCPPDTSVAGVLTSYTKELENPNRWAIYVVPPLPLSVSGRVALLGDAVIICFSGYFHDFPLSL
jgi:salicylate hydroxylase